VLGVDPSPFPTVDRLLQDGVDLGAKSRVVVRETDAVIGEGCESIGVLDQAQPALRICDVSRSPGRLPGSSQQSFESDQ
jgi:hypothetical protein